MRSAGRELLASLPGGTQIRVLRTAGGGILRDHRGEPAARAQVGVVVARLEADDPERGRPGVPGREHHGQISWKPQQCAGVGAGPADDLPGLRRQPGQQLSLDPGSLGDVLRPPAGAVLEQSRGRRRGDIAPGPQPELVHEMPGGAEHDAPRSMHQTRIGAGQAQEHRGAAGRVLLVAGQIVPVDALGVEGLPQLAGLVGGAGVAVEDRGRRVPVGQEHEVLHLPGDAERERPLLAAPQGSGEGRAGGAQPVPRVLLRSPPAVVRVG